MTPEKYERELASLQRRIAHKIARHESFSELSFRLVMLRVRQIRSELREERKQRKAS